MDKDTTIKKVASYNYFYNAWYTIHLSNIQRSQQRNDLWFSDNISRCDIINAIFAKGWSRESNSNHLQKNSVGERQHIHQV